MMFKRKKSINYNGYDVFPMLCNIKYNKLQRAFQNTLLIKFLTVFWLQLMAFLVPI